MTTKATATIIYPETDGMPLPDGEYQAPLYIRIVGILITFFRNIQGARVNGDTFIYYVQGNPRRFFSPDCYVALDLTEESIESIERNNTYLLWEVWQAAGLRAGDRLAEHGERGHWQEAGLVR